VCVEWCGQYSACPTSLPVCRNPTSTKPRPFQDVSIVGGAVVCQVYYVGAMWQAGMWLGG